MAERGRETLRHGPDEAVRPHRRAHAGGKALRRGAIAPRNKLGTLFNMVGFQTKLKHGEQVRIFRTIPGLANTEFARLGGLHRNTFLNSPELLDETLRLKAMPRLRLRSDHRLRGLRGIGGRSVFLPAALPPRSGSANGASAAADHRARALIGHITAPYRDDRFRRAPFSR